MGLTGASTGRGAAPAGLVIEKKNDSDRIVAFAGNPNVGKSSLFNRITGMHQHTGNWPGKTVQNAVGTYDFGSVRYHLVDLPGCYSLSSRSEEETIAGDFIKDGGADVSVIVCDATCLERNLILVFQIIALGRPCAVCLNLCDEAARHGIKIDKAELQRLLGVPVAATSASTGEGVDSLLSVIEKTCGEEYLPPPVPSSEEYIKRAEEISARCVTKKESRAVLCLADRIITGRFTAFPVMAVFLAIIFWLTLAGANYPSRMLEAGLGWLSEKMAAGLDALGAPWWLTGVICDGAYGVTAKVVSVMLPPMAIFFPLFTLLEDAGFLPRIAFNLDRTFRSCATCGKQSLTMCMGLGCNAAGIIGCRIIDSPRERLIAVLTNSFVPCNGRFPAMIAVITVFFSGRSSVTSSLVLTGFVVLSVVMTLLFSKLLSKTILRGRPEPFTLELPPYRRPRVGQVIVRSIVDRTLFVLARAVCVAAPAGVVIWILANLQLGEMTLLSAVTDFLDPAGRLLGLDGVILAAFILGFPANELVIPVALMCYTSSGIGAEQSAAAMGEIFLSNGWTALTAICVLIFIMFHWPCSTSVWTIKKETGKVRYALLGMLLPTAAGVILCAAISFIAGIFL